MWAEGPAEIDLFSDRFGLPIVPGTRSRRFPSAKTWGRLRRTSIRGHTLVGESLEGAVVDERQDAERAVIQLVGGDEAREVGECPVEVLGFGPPRRLFPPPRPRPNSGSWRRGRTPSARTARTRSGPRARRAPRRGGGRLTRPRRSGCSRDGRGRRGE